MTDTDYYYDQLENEALALLCDLDTQTVQEEEDYCYDVYDQLEDEALARLRDLDAQSDEDTDSEGSLSIVETLSINSNLESVMAQS